MKDALKGYWPPRDPTDPKVILAALQQGGALGIYGDFLFGEVNRFGGGLLGTVAGPTIGTFTQAVEMGFKVRDAALGDEKAIRGADWLNFGLGNTPGANLFYLRPALDFLFINSLREAASPGYLARQDKRRLKDYGQRATGPMAFQRDQLFR